MFLIGATDSAQMVDLAHAGPKSLDAHLRPRALRLIAVDGDLNAGPEEQRLKARPSAHEFLALGNDDVAHAFEHLAQHLDEFFTMRKGHVDRFPAQVKDCDEEP